MGQKVLAKRLFIAGDEAAAAIGHNELVAFKAQHSSDAWFLYSCGGGTQSLEECSRRICWQRHTPCYHPQ